MKSLRVQVVELVDISSDFRLQKSARCLGVLTEECDIEKTLEAV